MLIPQKITEKLTPVALIYDIYYPLGAGTVTQHYEMSTYLPETTWEPGKAYTYTLIVAPRKLEVGVEENWDNWDNSNTDVLVP
jgi:hypothetical protein